MRTPPPFGGLAPRRKNDMSGADVGGLSPDDRGDDEVDAASVKEETRGGSIQAVEFALEILEFIARGQTSVGVSEMSRAFGTTKSRIHRHLHTLVSAGYLVRNDATERYSISARLMALGQAVSESFELTSAARDVARELRDLTGHAVAISQPEPDGNRILHIVPSRSNIEIFVKPGSLLAYSSSAQGKVSLAFGDELVLERVLSEPLEMRTPYTITDPEQLRREVEAVRRRRWAVGPNESMIGLNALAAPIFDALGGYVGAIAMTDSIQYIPETPPIDLVRQILAAAAKISTNLGYRSKDGLPPG